MSSFSDSLEDDVESLFNMVWSDRTGNVVPEADTVTLSGGAVTLDATFLYADLAGSAKIAKHCPWETAAKIIRAYLQIATREIRGCGGYIRSFDGDRVMGIFIGEQKNSNATRCAREIDWCVEKILDPKARSRFNSIKNNIPRITHCVGIDTGTVRAVRAGIRNNNDLIWIGPAASFSAKLSDVRNYPYSVYISRACYLKLDDDAKKPEGNDIWEEENRVIGGEQRLVYKTKILKTP